MPPLLLYGLAFLLGITAHPVGLIPALGLAFTCSGQRLGLGLIIALTGYCWHATPHSVPLTEVLEGEGIFSPTCITQKTQHGKINTLFRGHFLEFKSKNTLYKNLPIIFSLPEKGPPMDCDWFMPGKIKFSKNGWVFKPDLTQPWRKVAGTSRWAERRFQLKSRVKHWIENAFSHPRAASLLGGLATGDFDDRALSFDFSRFGLSHLLAISGFHFALFASFLSFLVRPFFNPKRASLLMLFLLGSYFIFLGDSPSVMRAFLTLFIFLFSPLLGESSRAESSLGAALLVSLVYEPMWAYSIGFQLSFLSTAAILILFPLMDAHLKKWFNPRRPEVISTLNWHQKGGLLILGFIRQALSLNIAILIPGLPALLYLFHQFPVLTLFYNLFFPFLVSISLFLLLLSLFIPWLHHINSYYTDFILNLTHELPPSLDITLQTTACTLEITVILLTIIFYFSLHNKAKLKYSGNCFSSI